MTDAGQLNTRVTIQKLTGTQNATGELVDSWIDIGTVWALIEPISGREFFAAQQFNSQVTHRVRLRHNEYTAQITPAMRLVEGSIIYDVQAVIDKGAHDFLEVLVIERQ